MSEQSRVWRSGFLLLAILVLICGATARRLSRSTDVGPNESCLARCEPDSTDKKANVSKLDLARWIVLVFIPSSWLMGVTTYLTTDLAAIPLLWVIPLAIYLLSFILAFAHSGGSCSPHREPVASLPRRAACAGDERRVSARGMDSASSRGVLRGLRRVPRRTCAGPGRRLSSASTFYVAIAAGGLLGGIFTALVAPLVFNRVIEYPLAVILACWRLLSGDARLPRPSFRRLAARVAASRRWCFS